ncbi:MAG: hypothetical protein IT340_04435 [Chloroflexi bacterium]|nr:hypothetical protein [Chloroflexota bacterium]
MAVLVGARAGGIEIDVLAGGGLVAVDGGGPARAMRYNSARSPSGGAVSRRRGRRARSEAAMSMSRGLDDGNTDDDAIILLDEAGGWALWLADDSSEAVVVHGHGSDGDDEAEWLFVECDAATDTGGVPVVRCPECDATVPEAQIEAWIAALPDTDLA